MVLRMMCRGGGDAEEGSGLVQVQRCRDVEVRRGAEEL